MYTCHANKFIVQNKSKQIHKQNRAVIYEVSKEISRH